MHRSTPRPITFCITDLDVGGAERSLVDLVTKLPAWQYNRLVLSLAPRPPGDKDLLVHELEAAGITVEFLNARTPWQVPGIVRQLARRLTAHRTQILQTFLMHANILGAAAGHWAGVPHIVAGIRVAEKGHRWHHWITRAAARWTDHHVCVSQDVARFTQQQARIPSSHITVIPNGIDPLLYPASRTVDRARIPLDAHRRLILFVGRLTRQKRVNWLLDRAGEFLAQLPQHDLLVVGQGEERSQLLKQLSHSPFSQRMHLLGWHADVPELLAACDLLVLASRWEGMPRVLMEAMASRKPVVTTKVEGAGELLGDHATQQMVAQNDPRGFVERVVAIASNPALASTLGALNRQRIIDHFHIDRTVSEYRRLYESLAIHEPSPGLRRD
jgi:glycosyltransferase involved in cell wall biosynthesis